MNQEKAFGWPGIEPRWTSSAKVGVGTSLTAESHIWFALSHGIVDEIYFPREDMACIRDMGLIVTDGKEFFSEEKRHTRSQVFTLTAGVPAYRMVNTCNQERYQIQKEVVADPRRDALLQRVRFIPQKGTLADYHLYLIIAPHLGNRGWGNTGWIADHKGVPMLFAERDALALAVAGSVPWAKASAGFVGFSDGWQDLSRHKQMTWTFRKAENGNVALTAEIDLKACGGVFDIAIGFGHNPAEAGHRALASLLDGFEGAAARYIRDWRNWQETLLPLDDGNRRLEKLNLFRVSASILRIHESIHFPGGIIASLSIPWGFSKTDEDLGGYHLIWPRDLVEAAVGLLAIGGKEDVYRVLHYLEVTQEAHGDWPQNMWMDGTPYWNNLQMDAVALPLLLVDLARREELLGPEKLPRFWPMVKKAAGFLVRHGPLTQQDRWEENNGYTPFTFAGEVAALLAAADLAEQQEETATANYLRETADSWNELVEPLLYATGTEIARKAGVEGHYIRLSPPETMQVGALDQVWIPIKNRPVHQSHARACDIISPDALALVRFGLRAPDDPRILNTIKVLDRFLKTETPSGPCWYRYTNDGYGEHEDGQPFDGVGIGRPWPLMTAERAFYELAAGHLKEAQKYKEALENFANEGGMIPEQIWDKPDIPDQELFFGRPSGSAMPLVWAHSEYVKLLRSLKEKRVFDLPPQPVERYQVKKTKARHALWHQKQPGRTIPAGKILRIVLLAPALVHWSPDGWKTVLDTPTRESGLGTHFADLPTEKIPKGSRIPFTFFWKDRGAWEGVDYAVTIK